MGHVDVRMQLSTLANKHMAPTEQLIVQCICHNVL